MKLYLGIGHGRTPAGHDDPGAVSGGLIEHDLARTVVAALAPMLRARGVTVHDEVAGNGHDPNWVGSANAANAWGADLALEIHFNAGGGTGSECLAIRGGKAEKVATAVSARLAKALGIRDRGLKPGDHMGFCNTTTMPAVIVEVCFLDNDTDRKVIARAGFATRAATAIAAGLDDIYHLAPAKPPAPSPVTVPHGGRVPGMTAPIPRRYPVDTLLFAHRSTPDYDAAAWYVHAHGGDIAVTTSSAAAKEALAAGAKVYAIGGPAARDLPAAHAVVGNTALDTGRMLAALTL